MKAPVERAGRGVGARVHQYFRDERQRPALHRYGWAAFWVLIAFTGHWLVYPLLGEQVTFSLFAICVLLIAWSSGALPAMWSLVASVLLSDYFFLSPRYSFGLKGMPQWWAVIGYSLCATIGIGFIESLRRNTDELQRQKVEMEAEVARRRRAEAELDEAKRQLRDYALDLEQEVRKRTSELNEAMGSHEHVFYSIAHDLRAPARAVSGFTGLLRESPHLCDEDRVWVERIREVNTRMDTLITDLLEYGRLNHTPVRMHQIELGPVVDEALAPLRPAFLRMGATVQVTGDTCSAWCDKRLVKTILRELIKNALEHARPSAPLQLLISTEARENVVRLRVCDNGVGIPKAYQQKVFRLFTRLGGQSPHCSGVGLAIVAKAAERMRGTAGVESPETGGARFWVDLPKVNCESTVHPRPERAMQKETYESPNIPA